MPIECQVRHVEVRSDATVCFVSLGPLDVFHQLSTVYHYPGNFQTVVIQEFPTILEKPHLFPCFFSNCAVSVAAPRGRLDLKLNSLSRSKLKFSQKGKVERTPFGNIFNQFR